MFPFQKRKVKRECIFWIKAHEHKLRTEAKNDERNARYLKKHNSNSMITDKTVNISYFWQDNFS